MPKRQGRRLGHSNTERRFKIKEYSMWKSLGASQEFLAEKRKQLFGMDFTMSAAHRLCIKCKKNKIAWAQQPRLCEECKTPAP